MLQPIFKQVYIYQKPSLKLSVEGMLYRIRNGCPWNDIPDEFGSLNCIFQKLNDWFFKGNWFKIFQVLIDNPDLECLFIDGSYSKAHQHSPGVANQKTTAIGKNRAGLTSKVHLGVDAGGLPVGSEITGGEINDCTAAPDLLRAFPVADSVVGDKSYDRKSVRQ